MITFDVEGLRIESEMNTRCHWRSRKRRFDLQKRAVWAVMGADIAHLRAARRWLVDGADLIITLTRIGPRKLDSDNLAGGFKGVRDEVAAELGIDDGSERLEWRYAQSKGLAFQYAIRIEIEKRAAATA